MNNTPLNNQQVIDTIDNFIKDLNTNSGPTITTEAVVKINTQENKKEEPVFVPKTDEEIKEFVTKHSAELVQNSVKSIMELQKITVATGDPEMMAGLASLIAASTGAIEAVNKMHLQNQKIQAAKELKRIDIESKKEIQRLKNEGYLNLPTGQTNILVATREEIIAQLTGKVKNNSNEIIEVTTLSSNP